MALISCSSPSFDYLRMSSRRRLMFIFQIPHDVLPPSPVLVNPMSFAATTTTTNQDARCKPLTSYVRGERRSTTMSPSALMESGAIPFACVEYVQLHNSCWNKNRNRPVV